MSFPTHSDSTELSNEAWWNSNPQFSEWVQLPASEVGEGTIAGDTSEQHVSMSADIIQVSSFVSVYLLSLINARLYQGQDESQAFIVPGLNPPLGSRFESTQSPTGFQLDGPNDEGGCGASHHTQSAAAFPSLVDQAIMGFGQNDSCLILVGAELAYGMSLLATAKSPS